MTVGELKAAIADAPDSAEVFVDVPNEAGEMCYLETADMDGEGDLVLSVEEDDSENPEN